jgi:hypothetical protein
MSWRVVIKPERMDVMSLPGSGIGSRGLFSEEEEPAWKESFFCLGGMMVVERRRCGVEYKGIDILLATHGYAVIGPPPLHTILKARTKETNKQTHKQTVTGLLSPSTNVGNRGDASLLREGEDRRDGKEAGT